MSAIADVGSQVDPSLVVSILVTVAAFVVAWWLAVGLCRAADRETPQPPEPPGTTADLLCVNQLCDRLWTRDIHGWRLCDGCADIILADYRAWEAETARKDTP